MENEQMTKLEVGRPFPFPVPNNECAVMGLWEVGPVVLIQKFGVKAEDEAAFKNGFKFYSYLETRTPIPIAMWSFEFPEPIGLIDTAFNVKIAHGEWLVSYLNTKVGGVMNAFFLFLLDGKILRGTKIVGLDTEAVTLFHGTIRKQLQLTYNQEEFNQTLVKLFQVSPRELFETGRIFRFEAGETVH
ncbi:MAG: hypothetical protein JRJ21_04530 [Deltaproteobacteria bacterium]|nr:hypothetical protein [Deltaproteobacteria bacterium]